MGWRLTEHSPRGPAETPGVRDSAGDEVGSKQRPSASAGRTLKPSVCLHL